MTVKLLDFGLARHASEESTAATRITEPGTTVGTVAYMSPEQARGEDVDASADLWALGVIAFELLSGRRPFSGTHPATLLHAILYDTPPDLKTLRPDLPEPLRALVARALAKDKAARQQSAEEVLAELQAATAAGQPAARPFARCSGCGPLVPAARRRIVAGGGVRRAARVEGARGALGARAGAARDLAAGRIGEVHRGLRARRARRKGDPGDPMLARLWPTIARTPEHPSQPAGATVSYKDYDAPQTAWVTAGVTPLAASATARGATCAGVSRSAGFARWWSPAAPDRGRAACPRCPTSPSSPRPTSSQG